MTRSRALRRPAAVVFDNDGTFLATDGVWARAEAEIFARRGLDFEPEHRAAMQGASFAAAGRTLARYLGAPGDEPALLAELVELVEAELDGGVETMPGADELVAALAAHRIPIGMATNASRRFATRALARAGHGRTFPVLVAAEEVSAPKPAPDVFLAAADALGVAPDDCVALEDSPRGVAAARAAGMTVVAVVADDGPWLDADVVVSSLADPGLLELLGLEASTV